MANIKQIATTALSSIDSVLNHWCAGGKREGNEYVVINPTRSDSKAGSFKININTGAWSDFATGDKGGDLVALVAYLDGIKMGEAAKCLAGFLGIKADKTDAQKRATNSQNSDVNTSISSTKIKQAQGKDLTGFECVMPIPMNPPDPPNAHARHGKPSMRYAYLSEIGTVNFYHDRYEPKKEGDRKQFSPLTLWRNENGKCEWHFKAPPANRPLYNLPSLFEFKNSEVWIVEGEKAADALKELLPDRAVVTWQGGAQAVFKADFSPLSGRDCVVWPDNDQAGSKALNDVLSMLHAVVAKSIKIVDVKALAKATSESGYELQTGDDAADLLKAGFSAQIAPSILFKSGVLIDPHKQVKPENESVTIQESTHVFKRHFLVQDDGVYVVDVTSDHNAYKPSRWICSKLDVLAYSRSPYDGEWGRLVAFNDYGGTLHRFIIPARSFNGDGLDATGLLYENGLNIAPKARALVLEYLQQQQPEKMVRVTNRLGWHGEGDDAVFVMPTGAIGGSNEEWVFDNASPNSNTFKQKGTLANWRDRVACLCVGNSRLTFAVSIAFAAPLVHLLGVKDIGGFHYRGASSDGKSTALRLAGSVCGGLDYMQRWRASDNGLEGLAMQHCDAPLLLDEIRQLEPKIAGEAAYMLANGSGKARANEKGGARKTAQWRVLFLSAGEISLSQHMLEANKKSHAGQEIRMADIPSDAGAGLGCFENLHGHSNGSEFAKKILTEVGKNYGVAFPEFIEYIIRNKDVIPSRIKLAQDYFEGQNLTENASGQVRRVAGIFALIGAAGELATEAGLTDWPKLEAFKGAAACFKAWLHGFGGEGNQEQRAMLSQVRWFLEQHGEGRFADFKRNAIEDDHAARVTNKAGYRVHDKEMLEPKTEYYIYPEVFRNEVCKGIDYKATVKLLVSLGHMHKGDGRNAGHPQRNLPEGKRRVYVVYDSIFNSED